MTEYTFKYGPFYFKIHAETQDDAVVKARRAVEESFPEDSIDHFNVELTAGGFGGKLYINIDDISPASIVKTEELPEVLEDVPF